MLRCVLLLIAHDTLIFMQEAKQNASLFPIGLVVAVFGDRAVLETPDHETLLCHLRRNQTLPVVGDRAHYEVLQEGAGVLQSILPRSTLLQRGDARGREKPLAANVERLVIVMNPPPILSADIVDRYLVASELLGITPLLVINKIDLLSEVEKSALQADLFVYEALGYQVVFTSCIKAHGLHELEKLLKDNLSVLVGPSGVGKSSIIKQLTANEAIPVGEVSKKGIGKHTTTVTRLYHLPTGGDLIDSPGVRDFRLWAIQEAELRNGFSEIKKVNGSCRFKDCAHLDEPGCDVQGAVNAGIINGLRYEHYARWLREIRSQRGK
jgi:ribosome biogenesis GTPase